MAHAKLCPPSGWDRWSNCSASVDLQTNEGSDYAAEGTAAHFLADDALKAGLPAADYLGVTIWVPDAEDEAEGAQTMFIEEGKEAPLTGWTFVVDHAMADPVQEYMDQLLMQDADYLQFETKVPLEHVTYEKGETGTCDALRATGRTLASHDLKFGQGVKVYARENGQQLIYLLGGLEELAWVGDFDNFEIHIHQPRLGHHDVWEFDRATLEKWRKIVQEKAGAVTLQGIREFGPTTKGCRFCSYRQPCEARTNMAAGSPDDFPDMGPEDLPTGIPGGGGVGDYMAHILERVEFVEAWAKDMWAKANDMVKDDPDSIPGWGMFPGRGSRSITDEKLAKTRLRKHGFKIDQYAPRKMSSAAQVEKLIGKAAYKDWMSDIVEHKEGTPKLGRATGSRKSSNKQTADKFDDLG